MAKPDVPEQLEGEGIAEWRSQLDYFEHVRDRLWQDEQYRDRYVALRRQTVVDADQNKFELVKRVTARFPDEVVFIGKVATSPPLVRLPSPRLR